MTTRLKALTGKKATDFCIYRNQPLLLVASKWSERHWVTFLVVVAILIVPRLAVTITEGTFGPAGDLFGDLRAILLGQQGLTSADTRVPWLRDYVDIAIVLLMSAHTAHMVHQWHRINSLPSRLRDARLLCPSLHKKRTFEAILAKHESRFNSPLWELAAVGIASIGVVLLAVVTSASGIYRGLGSPSPALGHFSQWWANPDSHPLAFAVLMASYWLYLYLIARHACMGILVVGLLVSAWREADQHGESWLGYSSPWGASEEVILEMRGALDDIMVSITLLVSVFLIGNLYISLPLWLWFGFVLPYVVMNPSFLVFPSIELNRRINSSWHRLEDASVAELGTAVAAAKRATRRDAETATAKLEACRKTLDQVRSLPKLVIDWGYLAKAVLLYFVPAMALVPAFLGTHQ